MLKFDENGHLEPYEIIEISLPEFETVFVSNMNIQEHRQGIFQTYLLFINELFGAVRGDFYQLVDGSFTTTKEKPRDIDVVTFIEIKLFKRCQRQIIWFLQNSKQAYGIDSFFVPTCKPFNPFYPKFLETFDYWVNLFGHSREDEKGARHPKGIIKIQFSYEKFKDRSIL